MGLKRVKRPVCRIRQLILQMNPPLLLLKMFWINTSIIRLKVFGIRNAVCINFPCSNLRFPLESVLFPARFTHQKNCRGQSIFL